MKLKINKCTKKKGLPNLYLGEYLKSEKFFFLFVKISKYNDLLHTQLC